MKYRSAFISKLCAVAALLVFALTATAQESKEQDTSTVPDKRAASSQKNPEGISFTIRFKDGKSQFHQGEVIRLELAFASSQPHAYRLDNATYDRSGRLEIDTFHLTPKDAFVDPLYDYFHNALGGFMGGGLRGMPELESKTYLVTAELNEWFRFDKPGKYRLYVTTGRISKMTHDGRIFGGENVPATSNTVEFEILPEDPAWSKQKLQEATALLDANKKGDDRRTACRALRFLNTTAATREMARRFRGTDSECEFEYYIGLIGSPHRALAAEEMEKMLAEPEFPVTSSFINALSHIRYLMENPTPPSPYPNGDEEREKLWQAEMQKRRDANEQIVKNYLAQLSLAVSGKQKEAKAVSLGTLLDYEGAYANGKGEGARNDQLSSALTSVFLDLPANQQQGILAYRWKQIANPEMLPILRQIYEKPSQMSTDLRDIALRRIYDLAPDEGRQLILKEIESGHPGVRTRTLEILPEKTFPELDETLAAQMENDVDAYSVLIARYASSSIYPRIKMVYADRIGKWACAIQTPLLAYFLRVDPSYGAEMLEKALASRDKEKNSRCYASQLTELKGDYWSPEVEKVALAHLNDPHPEVMISAASVVAQYGSATDKQPLWDALERWHERYAGHEEAVRAEMKVADVYIDAAMIEIELARALGSANGWFMSADELKRLQQLCAGKQCKDEVASIIKQSDNRSIEMFFSFSDGDIESISVAQYHPASINALKEKLIQFPEGTTFKWNPSRNDEKAAEQLFADLQGYLKEHGMKLEKASSEK